MAAVSSGSHLSSRQACTTQLLLGAPRFRVQDAILGKIILSWASVAKILKRPPFYPAQHIRALTTGNRELIEVKILHQPEDG
jgi:hypothetical protein